MKNLILISSLLVLNYLVSSALCQHQSPCSEIFEYVPSESEPGKWLGKITLNTDYPLSGAWVKVILDRKVQALKSQFGEVKSEDNKEFLIKDRNYNLIQGNPLHFPIIVQYDKEETIPSVVSIRLNGRVVCPVSKDPPKTSKCPGVFSYNKDKQEEGVWHGTLTLESEFELKGAWIRIVLDHPAELLVNEFGEVRTFDNTMYLISNREFNVQPDRPFRVPFSVKYDPKDGKVPSIQTVRLNGRTVCGQIVSEDNNK